MSCTRFPQIWLVSFAIVLTMWVPLPLFAQNSALIFERTKIQIHTLTREKSESLAHYDVELRPEDSLKLEYIHTLNNLSSETGVLIGLNAPSITPLPAMKVYTPVDVLFIAEDGTVLQIAYAVILGEVVQPIQAKSPIKGLLFLKAGEAAAHGLLPHKSQVAAKVFTPAPNVQE